MAAEEKVRYKVRRSIGKGSYGEVFLVTHRADGKQYVMKNIKLTASSAKERRAAEQEASLLSRLKHPNIVSYRESFQDSSCILHIVMGYCEGGDLSSRLKAQQGCLLPERQVVEWFVQISLALQYLHDRNILHRDLKTQNIFLSKHDIIKVGDLGIARVLDGSCDLAKTVVGTPYYMSPELFSDQPYNHKSDIWALGCCVYEMATLKHPFSAHNINALMVKIVKGQKVPKLPQQFSSELSGLVQVMLSRDAAQRPSVHLLLRKEYIRTHIKMFLDTAASRKSKKKARPQFEERCVGERSDGMEKLMPSHNPQEQQQRTYSGQAGEPQSRLSLARERRRRHRQVVGRRRGELRLETGEEEVDGPVPAAVDGEMVAGGVVSSSSSSLEEEGYEEKREEEEVRREICGREEEEFYTLLDSTLHCEGVSDVEAEVCGGESAALHPGRLRERIAALRRECEVGLGKEVVSTALSSLDMLDPENDPDMELLLPVLGCRAHELYGPKLRQLWLCEDALRDH